MFTTVSEQTVRGQLHAETPAYPALVAPKRINGHDRFGRFMLCGVSPLARSHTESIGKKPQTRPPSLGLFKSFCMLTRSGKKPFGLRWRSHVWFVTLGKFPLPIYDTRVIGRLTKLWRAVVGLGKHTDTDHHSIKSYVYQIL